MDFYHEGHTKAYCICLQVLYKPDPKMHRRRTRPSAADLPRPTDAKATDLNKSATAAAADAKIKVRHAGSCAWLHPRSEVCSGVSTLALVYDRD